MANITLSGNLYDPVDESPDVGAQMRFTHNSTTGNTVKYAQSEVVFPAPDAAYNFTLEYGSVIVEYKTRETDQYKPLGVVTVNDDNPATSIPELLNAMVPVTDDVILEMQAILADAVSAQEAAEDAADRAEDAADETAQVATSAKVVARALNVVNSEVIEVEVGASLDGVMAVYDPTQEISYYLDDKVGAGETITSLTDNVLVTSGDTYYLRVVPDASTTLPVPVVTALNGNELETRVDGGITFTRATTRHNLNKSGVLEELAIDEAGVTKDGFSLYGSVLNILTYSEDFSQADWAKTRATITTDGTLSVNPNVDAFVLTQSGTDVGYIRQTDSSSLSADDKVLQFAFVKSGSSSIGGIRLALTGGSAEYIASSIDMSTEVFTLDVDATDGGYVRCNDGWYLIWHVIENTGANTTIDTRIYPSNTITSTDGEYIYAQHAQVSIGCCLDPYVKTESSQVTTTPDLCSFNVMSNMPTSGSGFSICIDAAVPTGNTDTEVVFSIGVDQIQLRRLVDSGSLQLIARAEGLASEVFSVPCDGNKKSIIITQDEGVFKAYLDGSLIRTSSVTDFIYDPLSSIEIGSRSGDKHLNGEAENLRVYHSALTAKQVSKEFVK